MKTRTQKQYSKPYNRRIHCKNGEWSYRIARGMLWVRSPDGNATVKMSFDVFTGVGRDSDGYGGREQPKVTIRPSDIKDFIENGFEPVTYAEGNDQHFRREVSADSYFSYHYSDDDPEEENKPGETDIAAVIGLDDDGVNKYQDRYSFPPEAAPWFLPEELDALLKASSFFEGQGTPHLRDGLRPYHETALLKLRQLFKED